MGSASEKRAKDEQRRLLEEQRQAEEREENDLRVAELFSDMPAVECSVETPNGAQLVTGHRDEIVKAIQAADDNELLDFSTFTWIDGDTPEYFHRWIRREIILGVIEWTPDMWEKHIRSQVENGSQAPMRAVAG